MAKPANSLKDRSYPAILWGSLLISMNSAATYLSQADWRVIGRKLACGTRGSGWRWIHVWTGIANKHSITKPHRRSERAAVNINLDNVLECDTGSHSKAHHFLAVQRWVCVGRWEVPRKAPHRSSPDPENITAVSTTGGLIANCVYLCISK